MKKKLSLRARAALFYFANSNMTISATRLSDEVAEGRDAIRAAMRELRDAGFLETKKERVGNSVKTISYVTNEGFLETESWGLKSRLHTVYTEQSNTIPNILTYSYIDTNKVTIAGRLGEEKMGYDFFESTSSIDADDKERDRLKSEADKRSSFEESKSKDHQKKVIKKEDRQPANWSVKDSLLEFLSQMNGVWNISPWKLSNTRFFEALGANRKKYGTNGLIEQEMMNLFFTSLKTDTQYDGDKLWRVFIARFSELSTQAKVRIQTPEKLQVALEQSEDPKNWKGL